MVDRSGAFHSRNADPAEPAGTGLIGWLKQRVLAAALSAATTITFLSLISPAWLDFMFDLIMVGLIALVGKLARNRN